MSMIRKIGYWQLKIRRGFYKLHSMMGIVIVSLLLVGQQVKQLISFLVKKHKNNRLKPVQKDKATHFSGMGSQKMSSKDSLVYQKRWEIFG